MHGNKCASDVCVILGGNEARDVISTLFICQKISHLIPLTNVHHTMYCTYVLKI